ncbi:hypothetical protein SLS62_001959 [Diatrype stigma]|uniref:DNA replication factor Cdt1 C-terminal domain-containing protein n=1 Tax=Diatrype stigma TaxID=117547 RepID=A0AAN9UYQ0_9PEZI
MPTAVAMKKIRKAQGAAAGGRSNKVAAPQQSACPSSNINSFARVSKSIGNSDLKKASTTTTPTSQKNVRPEATTTTPDSRKRKAAAPIEDSDSSADDEATPTKPTLSRSALKATATATATPSPAKRGRGRPPKKARPTPAPAPVPEPATKPAPALALRKKRARSPSPSAVSDSEKSTVDAGALFKRLRIESSPSRCSSPATADTSIAGSDDDDDDDCYHSSAAKRNLALPDDLLALIDLHSAFLKTLTLHYAHNGTNVPADLRLVLPNVARAWGKKAVTEADVRVCLGVLNLHAPAASSAAAARAGNSLFSLSNYGRGKICVEIDPSHGSGPLDEKKLNGVFRANLTSLWIQHRATNKGGRRGGGGLSSDNAAVAATAAFVQTLPKAPITLCESVAKASPVLAKGQRRLEELKHGIALKNQNQSQKTKMNQTTTATTTTTTTTNASGGEDAPMRNADGTKMSLLDRIRHKALQKSLALGGGGDAQNLTPAQLARRAALQRAPAVAAVVGMLARASSDAGSGNGRVSFTMAALLEKLKDSLRSGISRDEGAACVRRLAAEVAPEWVRVVVLAGRGGENVVVEVERQPSKAEVERRVAAIVGATA